MIGRAAYLLQSLLLALLLLPGLGWAQDTAETSAPEEPIVGEVAQQVEARAEAARAESAAAELVENLTLPNGAPDYNTWSGVALRAEQVLEAGRASDQALATLRDTIVGWRDNFSSARTENRVPIATLRNQIAALGTPPADGQTESETVARQREELNGQLAELERPVLAAELAFARADTIIGEIDDLLRVRQAEELMSTGASPLNPGNWTAAFAALNDSFRHWGREISQNWSSSAQYRAIVNHAVATAFLFVLAMVLLFGGRRLAIAMGNRVLNRGSGPAQGVWSFLISLGEVIFPTLGLVLLVLAVQTSEVFGVRSGAALTAAVSASINLVIARWIGARVFGRNEAQWELLNLTRAGRAEGRVEAVLLGFAFGYHAFVRELAGLEGYAPAVQSVLDFPALAFTGVVLMRIGRLFRRHALTEAEQSEDGMSFRDVLLSLGGRAVMLIGIGGVVIALLGYNALAEFIVYNTSGTMALVGVLLIIHVFFVDLYGTLAKKTLEEAQQALWPVLGSLVVFFLSIPFLALIWGLSEAELAELWARAGQGIAFGDNRVTPVDLLMILVIFVLGFGATRLLQGMLKTTVLPKTKIDLGGRNAITSGIGYVGYFIAAIIAITSVGINLSSLAVVFGALSVGIGFGLQNIVSNFVSGIILLIERPISEGDWIDAGGQMGIVKDISVRSTTIETFDKTDVVVPNSDLISGVVTNYTRGNRVGRLVLNIGVGYNSDTHRVSEILMEVAQNHPLVAVNPEPQVGFMDFGADALMFQIRAILSDVFYINVVRDEFNHEIMRRFRAEGIEIPFAQRDIWLRNPETLAQAARGSEPAAETVGKAPVATARKAEPELEDDQNRGDDPDDGVDGGADTT